MNFVFDIDGTLCFDGRTIHNDILAEIDHLLTQGHEVIFASARPIRDLIPVLPKRFHHFKLVGGNGAFVSHNGNIRSISFDEQTKKQLLQFIEENDCTYLADCNWNYSFTGDVEHPIYRSLNKNEAKNIALHELEMICKLLLFNVSEEKAQQLQHLPVVVTKYKSEEVFDISPQGVNKVRGLQSLNVQEFIAFGNDANDRCMFEAATHSVCVGEQDVKQFASEFVARENVAQKIRQLAIR